ncbi:MAG TPA: ketopantoate reductase family protein [Candidatus Acidoferrum sp.]|jgi:2-dehydropantoate 2-reductase|nr:ketopantoate reductase family protein [Candidatus Acidoferrum sp.]
MRHAILGAGGVGGLIGAALAKSGESVTLVLRPEALKTYPAELSLESPLGSFSVPVDRAASVSAPCDVLWITVKATQLEAALRSVTVDPAKIGAVVPLLNGIDHVALLRARFGHDRVVPASIGVEAERLAPGKIVHRGMAIRLSFSSIGESRLASTVEEFKKFGFACQFVDDEMKILWTKLSFLAPFALTTTSAGLTIGEVNRDPVWRKRLEAVVREVAAVGTASGTPLDPAAILQFFDKTPQGGRSSMQKDVAAGNPPEVEAIAGPILRCAEEHGLDVPVTRELAGMIRQKSSAARAGER